MKMVRTYVATDFEDIQFSTVTFTHVPQIYMLELHECTLLEYLHIHTYCMCSAPSAYGTLQQLALDVFSSSL